LLSLFPGTSGVFGGDSKLDVHAQQLIEMRSRIKEVKKALAGLQGQHDSVHRELEVTEKDIGRIGNDLRRLKAERRDADNKHKRLVSDVRTQRQRLDTLGKLVARDLRAAYLLGKQERVKLLLNQEDPAIAGRMAVYHGYFTDARVVHIHSVGEALNKLRQTETELLGQIAVIEEIREEARQQSEKFAQRQAGRRLLLERLRAELGSRSSELDELHRNERQLGQLIKALQQTGVQIDANEGDAVHAISKGRVAFADWLRGFGLLLIIEHGDGYMSLYGHNRSLYKDVGEWVHKDEVVAEVGNSGGSLQAGLYLELRKEGHPVNPAPWFSGNPAARHAQR